MKVCYACKRRDSTGCEKDFCPMQGRYTSTFKSKELKSDFFGGSPAPFVGRYGYPEVNVGILAPPGENDSWHYDAPKHWAKEGYSVNDVSHLRSGLVNSRFKANVTDTGRLLSISQEVGMASKPVEVEISLKENPLAMINHDTYAPPTGPNAHLKKIDITSNPSIHTKVEKVFSDTDLKAEGAINYLFSSGFDENLLSKMLSVGTVGLKKSRKLVPTRWSITAVDDMIGKNLLSKVKDFSPGDCKAYFGSYLGNYYLVLFFSDYWSYELFETMVDKDVNDWSKKGLRFSTDFEGFSGRTNYAEETSGGYYTVRLAIAEKLKELKRQGSVLALRFITDEYSAPLGVWVTREATRNALSSAPISFADQDLMMTYASHLVKKKFGIDLQKIIKDSKLIKNVGKQKRLVSWK